MVKKKRTAAQFFDNAESNGHKSLNNTDIDGNTVFKHIESGIEVNYNQMLVLCDEWVSTSLLIATKSCKILTMFRFAGTDIRGETLAQAPTI